MDFELPNKFTINNKYYYRIITTLYIHQK